MDRKITPTTRPDKGRRREDRLKSALKANLARRKAQIRGRKDSDTGTDADADTHIDTDKD
ncbi:MAG: hypothetical protein ACQEUH_07305 [Pseudomonadota bacterium]